MKPRDYCESTGCTTAELIEKLKMHYPKYSSAANSLCNHTAQTGVCLCSGAVSVLKAPHREKRSKPNKFTFRLLDSDAERLRAYMDRSGETIQAIAEAAITDYLLTQVALRAWEEDLY